MSLEQVDQAFDDYIAAAPGQFRSPLRSIVKLVQLLGEFDGEMDAGTREYADHIRASVEHLTVMLKDLKRPGAPRATVGESRCSARSVAAG